MSKRLEHALKHSDKFRNIKGYVYFVQCQEFTKVGFAKSVPARMADFRTCNPYPVALLRSIACENPIELEALLHDRLDAYHVRGEWFKIPLDVMAQLLAEDFKGIY